MSQANTEQLPAIHHQGGVLLKAGAGSGKTFVLVEHMIHLTQLWREEWLQHKEDTFSDYLSRKYAATVLMTFTKLAAGEIGVRLSSRFQRMVLETSPEESEWWQTASDQLDRLTVTTIDGFFYKLVRRGYFPQLPPDVNIIMSGPRQKRLLELFDLWWEHQAGSFPESMRRDAAVYRAPLANTLLRIFNDPALRDAWMQFTPEEARPEQLGWLLDEVAVLEGWQSFLSCGPVEVPDKARQNKNKWVALADALNERPKVLKSWEGVLAWSDFAESDVGQTVLSLGGSKELVGWYFDEWRNFKTSVKKWAQAYRLYEGAFDEKILPWYESLISLMKYLDASLSPADGITYGDLEYYVLRFLRNPAVAQRVQKDFSYFIVDEFQDTSRVQFEVLNLLCGGDYRKLFCVGDAKQAIYGFRGGELKVFLDLEQANTVTTLPLASNYRSLQKVVNFNNSFFETIFPLGEKWQGRDPHAVRMEAQSVPAAPAQLPGEVKILRANLPDVTEIFPAEKDKKSASWRNPYLNQLEAVIFSDYIQERLSLSDTDTVAILYKKLAPSTLLMAQLMAKGVGFTAQAKIPYADDPIAGLLHVLLQDLLGKKEGRWSQYMVMGYLRLLHIEPGEEVAVAIAQFGSDGKIYGLETAFDLFLGRLGLANALHAANLAEVKEILALGNGDLELVWGRLAAKADERWSANFRFGKNPHRVIIQTSHGSKGLEYDVVLVGGLATNGIDRTGQDWIGAIPGSVLWLDDPAERRKEPTLQFLYEKALDKQKKFAESKRLLYVACTRAKKELVFLQLHSDLKQYTSYAAAWSTGLLRLLEREDQTLFSVIDTIVDPASLQQESDTSKPLFHLNPLGLSRRFGFSAAHNQGVTSELSVTRLGALLECPRKFYFKNILKLPEPSEEVEKEAIVFGDVDEVRALSSSERGSAIHLGLSEAIKRQLILPLDWVNSPEKSNMQWMLDQLRPYFNDGHQLISEETFKFPLFEFMLTGIPDLLVFSEEKKSAEVWDFKTGRRTEMKEIKYWQQLEAYAYGLWILESIPKDRPIKLQLAYVDEKLLVPRELFFTEVKDSLFERWKKLADLHAVNLEHCAVCPYGSVCPK